MSLRAGRLRHRVDIYKFDESAARNESGGVSLNDDARYRFIERRYANIEVIGAAERFTAEREQSNETHRIVMRADWLTATLAARDRIVFTDRHQVTRKYDLSGAFDPDERGEMVRAPAIYRPTPGTL